MKRLLHIFIAIATVSLTNCSQDDNAPTPSTNPGGGGGNITATCSDGIQNGDETGVDCGGSSCVPCSNELINITIRRVIGVRPDFVGYYYYLYLSRKSRTRI